MKYMMMMLLFLCGISFAQTQQKIIELNQKVINKNNAGIKLFGNWYINDNNNLYKGESYLDEPIYALYDDIYYYDKQWNMDLIGLDQVENIEEIQNSDNNVPVFILDSGSPSTLEGVFTHEDLNNDSR